jgi:Peptidase family M28
LDTVSDILRQLTKIGPRPAGSEAVAQAFEIAAHNLDRLDLHHQAHRFAFDTWETTVRPRLWVEGVGELPCEAMLGSPGGSFSGRLEHHGICIIWGVYMWKTYRVRGEDGRFLAYVLVRPDGPTAPQPVPGGGADIPHLAVGKEAAGVLDECASSRGRAEGELRALPKKATGYNLRAWAGHDALLGQGKVVFVTAHCDTAPSSPGAYDNAGGVAALLGVAEMVSAGNLRARVQLLLTDAEELHLAGARAFVAELARQGRLQDIDACVNLDGTGRGEALEVWVGPEQLAERLCPIVGEDVRFVFPLPPPGDHYAFWERGIPSVMLTFNDPDILHRPEDVFDPRKVANAQKMEQLAANIVSDLTEDAPQ